MSGRVGSPSRVLVDGQHRGRGPSLDKESWNLECFGECFGEIVRLFCSKGGTVVVLALIAAVVGVVYVVSCTVPIQTSIRSNSPTL